MQLDRSHAIVPVFGGEYRILYRETQLQYIVRDHENPTNHLIYEVEQDLGVYILHISPDQTRCVKWVFLPLKETNLFKLSSQNLKQMKMTNYLSSQLKFTIELKY